MKEPRIQSVTTTPPSSIDDQGVRMRRYLTAMGFRLVCGVLAIVTNGWVRWTLVAAALVLPYIAVVLANAVGPRYADEVLPVDSPQDAPRAITGDDQHPVVPGQLSDETPDPGDDRPA